GERPELEGLWASTGQTGGNHVDERAVRLKMTGVWVRARAEGLSRDCMLGAASPTQGVPRPRRPPLFPAQMPSSPTMLLNLELSVPSSSLTFSASSSFHQEPELQAEPQQEPEPAGKWVLCNYDFQARNSSELSVKQQDVLEVLDDRRKWWKVRDQQGQEGYVPYNILTPHRGPRRDHSQSPARSLEHSTPPPPPGPAPAPGRPHWDSCDSLNNLDPSEKEKFSQMLSVNEELQARLAQGRASPGRAAPGPRAQEPQLSRDSDAGKVRAWLQAKGFSPGTVTALGLLSGAQLFSLEKEELRAVSPEEGARVYSLLTVQRALLEDKEKVSELEAVMEKQKKKVEGEMKTEII
ncbi:Hypothetical predicted protein, partial [Marmota monax]